MSKINNKAKHILLLIALVIGVFSHIAYMCYLRHDFAVGGEWFIYGLAMFALIHEVTQDD